MWDSAPGLDGLSYAWWALCPPDAHELPDAVARQVQAGGDVPTELSRSVTVTIPKIGVLENSGRHHPPERVDAERR